MAKGNQPPADDITLRDVINHMNHKFGLIDSKFDGLEGKMNKGFQSLGLMLGNTAHRFARTT